MKRTLDNSPAIYRWDQWVNEYPSPVGTAECFSRPYGTQGLCYRLPTDESVGYYQMSLRDKCGFEFLGKTQMSELRNTDSNVATGDYLNQSRSEIGAWTSDARQPLVPTAEELAVLSSFERFAFRVTHRMNLGSWKRFWTWCQSVFGAGWIRISTYNLLRVYGLENIEAVDHSRPILLVANHRSFFDFFTVSSVLFYRTRFSKRLFFPVRGRFFYQSLGGMFVNLVMGWWSMYPPFFSGGDKPIPEKREFDKYSFRRLTQLSREGAGNVIGFHPEGTRNKSTDSYSYLRPQPGVGKLIKAANPQVVPVFIAGLGNELAKQVLGNWRGGEKIRIHFGKQLDLSEFIAKKDHVRTYKEIGEFVMSKIAELGEEDRKMMANYGVRRQA